FPSDSETIGGTDEPPATPDEQAMRTDTFYPPMQDDGLIPDETYGGASGNLQTVCVRTCDGGFFPMTANASPLNFSHDAATCAKMCPGVPTELYYRSLLNEESSEMVSAATGERYRDMS